MSSGSRWSGTRVLVTGGQGFVGSWLVERLLSEGARPVLLRRPAAELSKFALTGLAERCVEVEADLLDVASLRRALDDQGVSAVFHLAALSTADAAAGFPPGVYRTNVGGTWTLLEACRTAAHPPERVVVASTGRVYGDGGGPPYGEQDPLSAREPYNASKACADIVARSFASGFGLAVGVVRCANVFGGGDRHWSRLVPGSVRALLASARPELRSSGEARRDFLYVEDAVAAYVAVAESLDRADLRGRAWNAGLGGPVAVIEVVQRLIEIAGAGVEPEVGGRPGADRDPARHWLDCSALEGELGWRPRWDLDRGLEATLGWYSENLEPLLAQGRT